MRPRKHSLCSSRGRKILKTTIDDQLVVDLIEYQAFESFWHRKADEQSAAEFDVIHRQQNGQHDIKWNANGE
eukprot:483061-Pyramimonas_sp.AAC.1